MKRDTSIRWITLLIMSSIVLLVAGACGGGSDDSNNNAGTIAPPEELTLEEGQFYMIQSTGAINDTIVSDNWGGAWPGRRLVDAGNWWTLLLGGSNSVDATAISLIQLNILKDLEPGTYTITEGGLLIDPSAETPVNLNNINLRYPDFEILNDAEEFNGTLTIEMISDAGMSGTIALSLYGEGGDVQVTAIFDVPVVEPFEPNQ
ncbi:MAG: hypothetical protein RLP44_29055 [Aggregatilineales bacterium]